MWCFTRLPKRNSDLLKQLYLLHMYFCKSKSITLYLKLIVIKEEDQVAPTDYGHTLAILRIRF